MQEIQQSAIEYLKTLDVEGCITGSALLEYYENADVDLFCYSEQSFTKLLYTLHFNPMFTILEEVEKWKFNDWTTNSYKQGLKKLGLVTIKFLYNTCIPINVIYKEKSRDAFSVISSFDMDVIAKAYDLKTKQYLDLTNGSVESRIVSWNKWNNTFYDINIWSLSRILRQLNRVVKYKRRNFETKQVALKYRELLVDMLNYESIFNSEKISEKVDSIKVNGTLLLSIIDKWLETEEMTDDELNQMNELIKII